MRRLERVPETLLVSEPHHGLRSAKTEAPYRKVSFLGFTKQIMDEWGNKTYQPALKYRLGKAGDNWLKRKSEKVRKMVESNEISVDDAASQMAQLSSLKDLMIQRALQRRYGGPA